MALRTISHVLEIDWGSGFVDESARLISASGNMQSAAPGSSVASPRGIVSDMTLSLHNEDGRYSPFNTQSPIYNQIKDNGAYQRPVRLSVSVGGGQRRVFTGTIKIPQEQTPTLQQGAAVSIDCRGREDLILTQKLITPGAHFVQHRTDGLTESALIAYALEQSGMVDGVDFISQDYDPSTATLQPGLFVIPWFWLDDENPISDCWTLAAACGGRFYADPNGVFRYDNAYSWLFSSTSVRTYTRADFASLRPVYNDQELYSGVSVEAAPRSVLTPGVMWEPDDVIRVGSGDTETITAKLRQPAYDIEEIQFTSVTAGGISIAEDVTVIPSVYAQRVVFQITNTNPTFGAYLRSFSIIGRAVSGATSHEEVMDSESAYWATRPGRVRSIRGNPYIQTVAQAKFLVEMLRDIHEIARPTYILDRTQGAPELRLNERITITDAELGINSRDAFVIGVRWQLSATVGFRQTVTAIDSAGYFPYMDTDGYFVLGVDSLNFASKRCFY